MVKAAPVMSSLFFSDVNAGTTRTKRMAMMAMTTTSSRSVKAMWDRLQPGDEGRLKNPTLFRWLIGKSLRHRQVAGVLAFVSLSKNADMMADHSQTLEIGRASCRERV